MLKGLAAPRYWLLWLGLMSLALSLIFALTPWWYQMERHFFGVPDEHYPELLWATFGICIAAPITALGGLVVWLTRSRE